MIASEIPELALRVETDRFGPFLFQVGVNAGRLQLPMQRVEDAHRRFVASPLAQVANPLEREVIASSIYGTNTIEGGTLTEDETRSALNLDPAQGLDAVRHAPWYASLYLKLNDKTRSRDLKKLRELELVFLDTDNRLWPGCIRPKNVKAP